MSKGLVLEPHAQPWPEGHCVRCGYDFVYERVLRVEVPHPSDPLQRITWLECQDKDRCHERQVEKVRERFSFFNGEDPFPAVARQLRYETQVAFSVVQPDAGLGKILNVIA